MISGKGDHMYKGMGVHFAYLISFFLNIPCNLKFVGPIGLIINGGQGGGSSEHPKLTLGMPLVYIKGTR